MTIKDITKVTKEERGIFITKVFSIVAIQLVTAFIMSMVPLLSHTARSYLYSDPYILATALLACVLNLTALYYFRKSIPLNYMFLFSLTICDAYLIGMILGSYNPDIVVKSLGFTVVSSVSIIGYAYVNRNYDFSWLRGFLICSASIIFTALAVQFAFELGLIINTLIALSIATLFAVILLYDVWRIFIDYPVDEYVMAVIDLHLSIINILFNTLFVIRNSCAEQDCLLM